MIDTPPQPSPGKVETLSYFVRSICFDIAGLVFVSVAAYGLITGHIQPGGEETAIAAAALYLGIKAPTAP